MSESKSSEALAAGLAKLLTQEGEAAPPVISNLARLSGGASQESWRFDAGNAPLLLRRIANRQDGAMTAETEALLIKALFEAGLAVPRVAAILKPEDQLGQGFLMERYEGETIARKLLRDEAYAEARPKLAAQCGKILAGIHAVPLKTLPALQHLGGEEQTAHYQAVYEMLAQDDPLFMYAFHWLKEHCPSPVPPALVHGDFRNGNLIIGTEGMRRVLDWELAHSGDPMEDLSWFCLPSWRFGVIDQPAGGFGSREAFHRAYVVAGGAPPQPERQKFWDVLVAMRWGVMCCMIPAREQAGVEAKVIGRRVSESELNMLVLLAPEAADKAIAEHQASAPEPDIFASEVILEKTEAFLREVARALSHQQGFHAAVAANGLAIAQREMRLGRARQMEEQARLAALTSEKNPSRQRSALNRMIAAGEIGLTEPELAHHFWRTTLARLEIDQPSYALYHSLTKTNKGN